MHPIQKQNRLILAVSNTMLVRLSKWKKREKLRKSQDKMCWNNSLYHTQPESNRKMQTSMINHMIRNSNQIRKVGCIDSAKVNENARILLLNPRGLNPQNDCKMKMLKDTYLQYQVNIILLNKTQVK